MKKCHLPKFGLLLLLLFVCGSNTFSQTIEKEKKQIVGTWVSEEGNWSFVFGADMKCSEYIEGKLEANHVYKITPANSVCGKSSKANMNDKQISFLQLDEVKTHERNCYVINGVSVKTLSISGEGKPCVFNRKVSKPSRAKKS